MNSVVQVDQVEVAASDAGKSYRGRFRRFFEPKIYSSRVREREEFSPAASKKTLSVAYLSMALSLLTFNHNRGLTVVKNHLLTRSDPL
jgi:hypothetical protein